MMSRKSLSASLDSSVDIILLGMFVSVQELIRAEGCFFYDGREYFGGDIYILHSI